MLVNGEVGGVNVVVYRATPLVILKSLIYPVSVADEPLSIPTNKGNVAELKLVDDVPEPFATPFR